MTDDNEAKFGKEPSEQKWRHEKINSFLIIMVTYCKVLSL